MHHAQDQSRPGGLRTSPRLRYLALATAFTLAGCASPGPPRAPSLHLPQPVRDLSAIRIGNTVQLHFTVPSNSTDKLALRGSITGQLCRQLPHQPCLPVPGSRPSIPVSNSHDTNNLVTWIDTLPDTLTQGPAQLLAYRVEFFNPANHSAGPSNQAFTATGQAPEPVQDLHAQGSRLGTILTWSPSPIPGDVVLQREDLAPPKPHQKKSLSATPTSQPALIWLQTNTQTSQTLDTTALPDTPYRYTAQRRTIIHLGSQTIQLRSLLAPSILFILKQIYPPPSPTGLTVAAYFTRPKTFAVDLIWQPIDTAGLITPLAGYNLYRQPLNGSTQSADKPNKINTLPLQTPSFHDTTADPAITYRYSVTAIDTKGNESPSAATILQPTPAP